MIAAQRCTLSLLLPALFLVAPVMRAQVPPLSTTYPQIVRLSLVEGDVRVSRGEGGEKATGSVWEKAALDVPLESGFSLVTGTGRAEIELEDFPLHLAMAEIVDDVRRMGLQRGGDLPFARRV